VFSRAAITGKEAMFARPALPWMESQAEEDHAFEEIFAGRPRRIGRVAFFAANYRGGLHNVAIIGTLRKFRRTFSVCDRSGAKGDRSGAKIAASGTFAPACSFFDYLFW
jgi:hypothetical protein